MKFLFLSLLFLGCYQGINAQDIVQYDNEHLPRLSPRPQKVKDVKKSIISLNGIWKFTGGKAVNKEIRVPGEWEMQGFEVDSAATATYSRKFVIPKDWKGKRIKLRFDAVSSHCIVKVNGKIVGEHEGSFVPFEIDITKEIKPGENSLEVDVQCQTISDILACTSQYAGHPVGGILRKVTLFALPDVNIAALAYATKFDQQYKNATLQIPFEIANEGRQTKNANIVFEIKDKNGKTIPLPKNKFSIGNITSGTSKKDTVSLQIKTPEKWNPEHPYLHTLITKLIVNGKVTELYLQKVGFREIEIRGNQLFVNDHPVKLHGVCRHSIYPFTGRSVSPALCLKDALLFREGNCNYIRTSHYPPSEEFLDACDSLGLFVESESSLCWIGRGGSAPIWKTWNYDNPKFLPYLINANVEKMIADRNHPSVIIWSLGNESVWSPLWAKVNKIVKQLDPSRPTAFQDRCLGCYNNAGNQCDIANYHYPNFNTPAASDSMKRPLLFDEFAHVANLNRREVLTDPSARTAWGPPLTRIYDSMYAYKGCLGGAIWAGIDDIFHMPNGTLIGYGPWGVIDGWRRKKPEYYVMKKAYAPVIIKNLMNPQIQDNEIRLKVENRYNFTNLSSLQIKCKIGNSVQNISANIPPRGTGIITIPLKKDRKSDSLYLTFVDPRGFVCQKVLINLKNKSAISNQSSTRYHVQLSATPDLYLVKVGNRKYSINRKTGLIKEATIDDKLVFKFSPALMIVPLNDDIGENPKGVANNYQERIFPLMYKPCDNWQTKAVHIAKQKNGNIQLSVYGSYKQATGFMITTFKKDGSLQINYQFKINDSIKINPRQWGLVFSLPRQYQYLSWNRKGHWTVYPQDDIGRNKGQAFARPISRLNSLSWARPFHPWEGDANKLGSNDFRSTKANIYSASLKNKSGAGLQILSDGTQSIRTWIDGDDILLLIADYNRGGIGWFSSFFYHDERRPLKAGDRIKGTVHLRLLN